jgi:hypothetical protein
MALGIVALVLAALPAALGLANLLVLRAPRPRLLPGALVSILIPARNERLNIGGALDAARATDGVAFEIVVMDDGSTDDTAAIVRRHATEDARVRLETAPPLPPGWAGKNHACQRLAEAVRGTHLLFIDADVRLQPHAAAALVSHMQETGTVLVSGVPRQLMRSLGELLTVPMINLLLLGYLPLGRMRATTQPSLGAACGQLVLVDSQAYRTAGGHAAIRACLHDALRLARLLRERGHRTDLVPGTGLASCRMYPGFEEAWAGFLKNATEGMARPLALPVWTVLLAGGHILPPVLLVVALLGTGPIWPAALATLLSFGIRAAITLRSGESLWTIPLHPATVATGLAIQWTALLGTPQASWKGRLYATRGAA